MANHNSVEYSYESQEQNSREEILLPPSPSPSLASLSSNHTVSSQAAKSNKRKREEAFSENQMREGKS